MTGALRKTSSVKFAIYGVLNTVASDKRCCALRAPTGVSVRIKSIRTETPVTVNRVSRFNTRSPIALGWLFNRAQSTIRADGCLSAQHCNNDPRD